MCIFLFLTTSKSKTWTKCLTVFYLKVFKFYFELIESLVCLLVVDDKFTGFDVSVCHNKNDALILVFPKLAHRYPIKKDTLMVPIAFSLPSSFSVIPHPRWAANVFIIIPALSTSRRRAFTDIDF